MSRRLPADQRRAQLLQAALEIAEAEGLGAVTVRGVADRAGVSLGVVHYCFTDKEELIRDVVREVGDDLHRAADAFMSIDFADGGSGAEGLRRRLVEAMDLIWAVISASPDRQLLTYEIVSYSLRVHGLPEAGPATAQIHGFETIIRRVLEVTSTSSGMRWEVDEKLLCALVLALVDGIGLRWQIERDDDVARDLLHSGIDMLVSKATPVD